MSDAFEHARKLLKQLPGIGHRSSERIALHLFVEHPEQLAPLLDALRDAATVLHRCPRCGNLCETELCPICADPRRDAGRLCIVEQVPDLLALERAGAHDGVYHVLHGKLSPINGVGPDQINLTNLAERLTGTTGGEGCGDGDASSRNKTSVPVREVILALADDVEGNATCFYLRNNFFAAHPEIAITRIGFGIPSGAVLNYIDPTTLKNAIDARRQW